MTKPILNEKSILNRNCKRLRKLNQEALDHDEFMKQKKKENLDNLFKSVGEMRLKDKSQGNNNESESTQMV